MAGLNASTRSPWYETLKGIVNRQPDPELKSWSARKPSRSSNYARKVFSTPQSPAHNGQRANSTPPGSETSGTGSGTPRSSASEFSFSRHLQPVVVPDSQSSPPTMQTSNSAKETPTKELPSTTKELTTSTKEIPSATKELTPHTKELPPGLPPPLTESTPPTQKFRAQPQAQAQAHHGSQPTALPLPLPPKNALEFEYSGSKDFVYQPKPEDRYEFPVKEQAHPGLGPEPKPKPWWWYCCGWLCTTIIVVALAFGIAAAVMIAVLKPVQPFLGIGDITVTSLNFTEGNGEQLKTGLQFAFILGNQNKYAGVLYSQISVSLSYKDLLLNNNTVPGFFQGTRRRTALATSLSQKVTIVPADIVGDLKEEIAGSEVQIFLSCLAAGKFKIFGLKMKKFAVPIYCQLGVKPGVAAFGRPAHRTCYHM